MSYKLNTRPNGPESVAHNGYARNKKKPKTIPESKNDFLNLTKDSVEDIWNSEFMRDFRMKKIKGEYIKFCETCYPRRCYGSKSKECLLLTSFMKITNTLLKKPHE